MKKSLLLFGLVAVLASCGSNEATQQEGNSEESAEVLTEEVESELQNEQDVNVELEQLDGEVDSLLNTL